MFRRVLNFFLKIEHREQDDARDGATKDRSGFGAVFGRSGMVTATLIVGLVAASAFAYFERGRGNLTRIERHIQAPPAPPEAAPPMPGGMAAIVLSRSQLIGDTAPQFLSATLLPGRGLNLLQITAFIPGRGEISLLASPTVAEAARQMTASGDDRNGALSLTMGGAPMVPWAGPIFSARTAVADASHSTVEAIWQGRGLHLPVTSQGADTQAAARGGLLLTRKADSSDATAMPDGSATTTTFRAGDFAGNWPSATDVSVSVLLSGRVVELTIAARNVGTDPEPMGIGWQPRFALPGRRSEVLVKVPSERRVEEQQTASHLPTGRLIPVGGTPYDLGGRNGAHLPPGSLEATYTNLVTGFLDDGPVVEMTDAARSYGLRMKLLSTSIRAVHVAAPAGANYVEIAPQFNLDDPFGYEWGKEVETGMKVLQPGQTAEWKVRLELFDPGAHAGLEPTPDSMPGLPSRRSPSTP